MLMRKNYFIEKAMILLMGEYDRYGKLCARVMAGTNAFLVDRTPLQLLDDTLTYIGFDLRGATSGAKSVLGKKVKCPIIVNPYSEICLFPIKSPRKVGCIWFNPDHIVKTTAADNWTQVELSNGYSITVDSKLSIFNDKLQTAQQLMKLSKDRGMQPNTAVYYLNPGKDHQLVQEESGKYNFHSLEKEQN